MDSNTRQVRAPSGAGVGSLGTSVASDNASSPGGRSYQSSSKSWSVGFRDLGSDSGHVNFGCGETQSRFEQQRPCMSPKVRLGADHCSLERRAVPEGRARERKEISQNDRGVDDLSRLAKDLRLALQEANHRRELVEDSLHDYEDNAAREYDELLGQLFRAREILRGIEAEGRRLTVSATAVAVAEHDRNAQDDGIFSSQLLNDVRVAVHERNMADEEVKRLEQELSRAQQRFDEEFASLPASVELEALADALGSSGVSVSAVEAVGADAVESMLRAEAAAMSTALRFYTQQSNDSVKISAMQAEECALQSRARQLKLEFEALSETERRLQLSLACIGDALRSSSQVVEVGATGDEALAQVKAKVSHLEANCQQLLQSSEPVQGLITQLRTLRLAAGTKVVEIQRALCPIRTSQDAAITIARRSGLTGVQALVAVLAQLCGSPRLTFLMLDANHNGKVSTFELDAGLRLRFGLNYEKLTGMKVRDVFRELDVNRNGVLQEEDFMDCCPEIWKEFGLSSSLYGRTSRVGAASVGKPKVSYVAPSRPRHPAALEECKTVAADRAKPEHVAPFT